MPDMTDLPNAPEVIPSAEETAEVARLKKEIESLRLTTHEDEADYWRSDEAMKHD